MQIYVMRANGIAVARRLRALLGQSRQNHAWEVLLDEQGHGSAGLFNRAAKVYRKMYSHNLENLFFKNDDQEDIPKWLAGRTFRDVTDQYMPTTDVSIDLTDPASTATRFAYICVFNGEQWQPIHWCCIDERRATFIKMGRNIVYLVGYFVDEQMHPAAPPFVLDEDGKTIQLAADPVRLDDWRLEKTKPTLNDNDRKTQLPEQKAASATHYEIMVWHLDVAL